MILEAVFGTFPDPVELTEHHAPDVKRLRQSLALRVPAISPARQSLTVVPAGEGLRG